MKSGPAIVFFHDGRGVFDAELAVLEHGTLTATGRFQRRRERVSRSWPMSDVKTIRWQVDVLEHHPRLKGAA